jgi:hypothetical protein
VALEISRTGMEIMGIVGGMKVVVDESPESSGSLGSASSPNQRVRKKQGGSVLDEEQTQVSLVSIQVSTEPQTPGLFVVGNRTPLLQSQQAIPIMYQQPSTAMLPWTHSHESLTFNQRLRLACIERGLQLLSFPDLSFSQIHPALSMHLKWMPIPQLRTLTEASLRSFPALKMYGPNPHPALPSPDLFRVVDGRGSTREAVQGWQVERKHGRDAECLVFGRTRTRVKTAMPGFEGEWLEARDVQEYPEDKGRFE